MREVLNTVGKAGKLGENVRCVVSVSMLTEGWDANTVTHILGVRAFGTQLLCEQVVGRGLRRMSYAANEDGPLRPGIRRGLRRAVLVHPLRRQRRRTGEEARPRSPAASRPSRTAGRLPLARNHLSPRRRLPLRAAADAAGGEVHRRIARHPLDAGHPDRARENAPIVGETAILTLDDLKKRREQEVAFTLAKLILEKYFRPDGEPAAADRHCARPAACRSGSSRKCWPSSALDGRVRRLQGRHLPATAALRAKGERGRREDPSRHRGRRRGRKRLRPMLQPYDTLGTTAGRRLRHTQDELDDQRRTSATSTSCRCDSGWETKFAQALEEMPEVMAYVKNQNLGFTIPYTYEGRPANYYPDYIVRIDDGHGADDLLNLVVEVSGQKKKEKEAKVGRRENCGCRR